LHDVQQDQKVAGFGQQQSIRDQADDGQPAGWHGPHEARVSELQMHVQIDLCMHMPCTSQHCRIRTLGCDFQSQPNLCLCSGQSVVCYCRSRDDRGAFSINDGSTQKEKIMMADQLMQQNGIAPTCTCEYCPCTFEAVLL